VYRAFFEHARAAANRAAIGGVDVWHVDVETRGRWRPHADPRDHQVRVSDPNFGRPVAWNTFLIHSTSRRVSRAKMRGVTACQPAGMYGRRRFTRPPRFVAPRN